MTRIYLSSTYADLVAEREAVYRALRRLGHDVIAMEDYVAADARPVDRCLADVRSCDVYIGLFAWRYGYVVPEHGRSITELEFRQARQLGKPCLIFLLHEDAPWPRSRMDRDPSAVESLRERLARDYLVSFFRTADELAAQATAAVATVGGTATGDAPGLEIADVVIARKGPASFVLDVKLYNPSSTVAFLTEIALLVHERTPYAAIVKPSAKYDLAISGPRNALAVSHEIRPQRAERILLRTAAEGMYRACYLQASLEFTYNGGRKLESARFGLSTAGAGGNEPDSYRPDGLEPIPVEDRLPAGEGQRYQVELTVWADIDAEVLIDGRPALRVDHRSGFDYASADVTLGLDSELTVRAEGLARTIPLRRSFVPGRRTCEIRVRQHRPCDVLLSEDEVRRAMGSEPDVPALCRELRSDARQEARAWAATRLGHIGGTEAVAGLLAAMRSDEHPYVRAVAARELGRAGDPKVLPELSAAYREYGDKSRYGYMFEQARAELEARTDPLTQHQG